jgi:EAL domain-containing protein (putative c-di-GMP-specific phosphodiesterase class I)
MNEKRNVQIHRMLGSLWSELMHCTDSVGAFVLWNNSREFYIDDNALDLLGMDRESLTCESLRNVLDCAIEAEASSCPAKVMTVNVDKEECCMAGFVIKRDTAVPMDIGEVYPLLNQTQLADKMTEAGNDAFLMLIQLEHIENGRDERAFIRSALEKIAMNSSEGTALAYHSGLKFWVFVKSGITAPQEFALKLQSAVKKAVVTDEFGVVISKGHSMTFTGGYVTFSNRETAAVKEFHYASFALYEAVSEGAGTISSFSSAVYELQKNDYRKVQNFFHVLDANSFMYHFQPIVSAKDGSIIAYEALMRTDRKYGLSPLQIIDMAAKYDRLYDIEHATMFNVLYQLSRNQSYFKKRKLFINAIPSSFLSNEDWTALMTGYGELMEKVVIELTEQTDTSDANLDFLINRLKKHKVEMAIDDYGTGYSNTSRLIRYDPQYIKLDHSLISGIDTNPKLRSIVSKLIDMMHSNGFQVLAEGVETAEEMRVLSSMNADLFQGFYISRPKPFFINEISESIRSEIVRYHLEVQGSADKIYHAKQEEREVIKLSELIREKYTGIYISGRDVEIIGEKDMPAAVIPVMIKEGAECRVQLRNVSIEAAAGRAALTLGSGSIVTVKISGTNRLVKGGILVPEKSELTLEGTGKLTIIPESISCFGIGNEFDLTYGKITSLLSDDLTITACGDNCVGIGGGKCSSSDGIAIKAGAVEISCSGANSIGIGSALDRSDITIKECFVSIGAASANFTGVGSIHGDADIKVENVKLAIAASGNTMCAVGAKDGGKADIDINNCEFYSNIKGREIVNIGSHNSDCRCSIAHSSVNLNCEGSMVSGIGDSVGTGLVDLRECEINIDLLAAKCYDIGCCKGELKTEKCIKNIHINQ